MPDETDLKEEEHMYSVDIELNGVIAGTMQVVAKSTKDASEKAFHQLKFKARKSYG